MTAYSDSESATVQLDLIGVWLHDPEIGGQLTVRHFPWGRSQRELAIGTLGETAFYAGRAAPVVEYGEHETGEFRVAIDVPHGADWLTQVEAARETARLKKTVLIRDNRGRALYAQIKDYRETDMDWGTRVSFLAETSSWDVETVSA